MPVAEGGVCGWFLSLLIIGGSVVRTREVDDAMGRGWGVARVARALVDSRLCSWRGGLCTMGVMRWSWLL